MRKVLLLPLAVVVMSACSVATESPAPDQTATGFPTTVTGTDGRSLRLEQAPERIVSLSATHTEILYAIGAALQIAGTDLTSDFPSEAANTPKVDAFSFNVEEIAALDPDLVILAFDFQGEVTALELIGVPAVVLGPAVNIGEMYDQILALGRATGHEEAASQLVREMRSRIEAALAKVRGIGSMSVYHEVDATLFSPNSDTFIGDLYAQFGLVNIADEVPDELAAGYVQLSQEFILSADPGVIFLGDAAFGESFETVAARPGWSTLSAVQAGRVYDLDADIAGRWGPRTVDLADAVAAALEEASP